MSAADPIIAWLRFLDNPAYATLASPVTESLRQKARRDGLVEFSGDGMGRRPRRWRLTGKGRAAIDFANVEAHERWKDRGQ